MHKANHVCQIQFITFQLSQLDMELVYIEFFPCHMAICSCNTGPKPGLMGRVQFFKTYSTLSTMIGSQMFSNLVVVVIYENKGLYYLKTIVTT